MSSCTRLLRVHARNAAVALATAALSCAGTPPGVGMKKPEAVTKLVVSGDEVMDLSLKEPCIAAGLETCFNATDDNCNGLVDEGCGLATGALQLVIAWDDVAADVDLEVTDPNGERAEVARLTSLGLGKDRDCPGEGDACGGQNFEVVTLSGDDLPLGRYLVTVVLDRPLPESRVVNVRVGGHLGQDAVRGAFALSAERPRKSAEFLRAYPVVRAVR